MILLGEAFGHLGALMLPVSAALLLEELTLGGLVRLLVAPWPGAGNNTERKNQEGERKCSH
jgi:hypothetical protein